MSRVPLDLLPEPYRKQAQEQIVGSITFGGVGMAGRTESEHAAPGREDETRLQFEQWCRFRGYVCWHVRRADLAPELDGMPDDIVHLPGGHMALIEFKTAKGTCRKSQVGKFTELRGLGHTVHICRSLDEARQAVALELAGQGGKSPFAFGANESLTHREGGP